jgi:two-component system, sensor histidine kinase and response regulator
MASVSNKTGPVKILLVDDNQDFLSLMGVSLRSLGHEVLTSSDPENGLSIAVAEKPDLILLDLYMPGMDGYELGRILSVKEETRGIPYVIVSSSSGENFRRKGVEWGAEAFIPKASLTPNEVIEETGPTAVIRKDEINSVQLQQLITDVLAGVDSP